MAAIGTRMMWGEPPAGAQVDGGSRFHVPAGTVTFLLSDIEGSTRLWSEYPEAMGGAVAGTYEILDRSIARYGGVRPVEQGEGDSVVGAFSRASDAVAAALEAQLQLHAHSWPDGLELGVRIALHTGDAQLRDEGNYFGLALSRCARLRAIAQGGQTLLSRATRDLVVDALPEGVVLVDCGVHRLRDLGRPEHVFGLVHPEFGEEVGALRSLDVFPNNLPDQLTSFVERSHELAQLREALAETRLLTLTGAGGAGLQLRGARASRATHDARIHPIDSVLVGPRRRGSDRDRSRRAANQSGGSCWAAAGRRLDDARALKRRARSAGRQRGTSSQSIMAGAISVATTSRWAPAISTSASPL